MAVRIALLPKNAPPGDLDAVDSVARTVFDEAAFSAAAEIQKPWARIWTAHEDTETSAPAAVLIAWHVADELHILNIATAAERRREGIGARLMEAAVGYAAAENIRLLLLEVRKSNRPAIGLYRKFGFTIMGIRPGYYAAGNEDALLMMLAFDPVTGQPLKGSDEVRIDSD